MEEGEEVRAEEVTKIDVWKRDKKEELRLMKDWLQRRRKRRRRWWRRLFDIVSVDRRLVWKMSNPVIRRENQGWCHCIFITLCSIRRAFFVLFCLAISHTFLSVWSETGLSRGLRHVFASVQFTWSLGSEQFVHESAFVCCWVKAW